MKSIIGILFNFVIYITCARYVYNDDMNLDMDHAPLTDLRVTSRGSIPKGLINAGPSALKVVFRAFNNDYELDMKLNKHLYTENAPASIQRHWTYQGSVTLNNWLHGHATFTFERDDYHSNFHGSLLLDKTFYQIQHADKHDNFADTEHRMVLSKHGEGKDFDVTTPPDLLENPHLHSERRRLNLVYFDNCWAGQEQFVKKLSVGYTIDESFQTKILEYMSNESGSTQDKLIRYITQVNADSNVIYHNQLDVILGIMDIKYVGQAGSWQNNPCPGNIGEYLDALTNWRQQSVSDTGGMWKALTNCYPPPGTVGYAYVGTLCRGPATGVSNYMNIASGGTWGVNAHEAGHIFGARHSFENGQGATGGIMDYGDGYFQDVFQFNPLRKNEVCGVLSRTIPATNNQAKDCWSTVGRDDGATYNWRKTGTFSDCTPEIGEYRWQSITYECEVYVNGEKRQGTMAECDVADYPWGEIKTCDANNQAAQCGNSKIEDGEECETSLDGTCCVDCTWSSEGTCNGVDSKVEAAIMSDSGVLYVVSRGNVFRYSQGQENGLDAGYPKTLQEEWAGITDEFAAPGYIGGIVRKPAGNMMWVFQGRDENANTRNIKYLEINYSNGQLITQGELDRLTLTDQNYGAESQPIQFDNDVLRGDSLSYTNDFFRKCGGVDAGLGMPNGFYLFCESFFVEFDWDMDVKTLRPVADLQIAFEWETKLRSYISAAYYNWHDQATMAKARFWNANYYIDWWGFRTVGLQSMAYPLTFQPVVVPPETGGGDDGNTDDSGDSGGGNAGSGTTTDCDSSAHCATCRIGMPTTCYSCVEGYELFGSICLEKTTDIQINFGTSVLDGDIQWLSGGVTYLLELLGNGNIDPTGGIGNGAAAYLGGGSTNADGSKESTHQINFAPIQKSFVELELSLQFKPDTSVDHSEFAALIRFTDGTRTRISASLADPDVGKNPHMVIDFMEGVPSMRCETDTSIIDDWNQFILKIVGGTVECCIRGSCVMAAYEGMDESALNFVLQDWFLGSQSDGIVGHVDAINLKIVTPDMLIPGVPKKTLVMVIVAILLLGILGVLGFKYRSDFLNPCGADSHDRTVSSKNSTINNSGGADTGSSGSWNVTVNNSGSKPPSPPPAAPKSWGNNNSVKPPVQPPLAKNTSFQKPPPAAPVFQKPSGIPKRPGANRPARPPPRKGIPSIKSNAIIKSNSNSSVKRGPTRGPPKRAPSAPGGPPPAPLKNLW